MKVFALSDLHLSMGVEKPMQKFGNVWDDQIPRTIEHCNRLIGDEDLLLIGGDISWAMREQDALLDLQFIESLKGKKIMVRGNHDYWWSTANKVRNLLGQNMYALHNDAYRFGKVVVGGNRGMDVLAEEREPNFEKLYAREMNRFDMSLAAINKLRKDGDTTILLTHYPPLLFGKVCAELHQKIVDAKIHFVVFGHIHASIPREKTCFVKDDVKYFLTSSDVLGHEPMLITEVE